MSVCQRDDSVDIILRALPKKGPFEFWDYDDSGFLRVQYFRKSCQVQRTILIWGRIRPPGDDFFGKQTDLSLI